MKAKILKGDLIKAFKKREVESQAHGCNCFCSFGAGYAKLIADEFPEAYSADLKTNKGDKNKLGSFSVAKTNYGEIFNLYSQFHYGGAPGTINFNYPAFESSLTKVKEYMFSNNIKSIGMPAGIGSGLARGNKKTIHRIINKVFENSDIEVKLYDL